VEAGLPDAANNRRRNLESYELCSRSVEVRAQIEPLIEEARQTIAASKALIDRFNRSDGTNRTACGSMAVDDGIALAAV
jgi:hypothetical protein